MPITVAYCYNALRDVRLLITSKDGNHIAPGCSNTITLDVDVYVYLASGPLVFTWEQVYGPPVELVYPDPLDKTLVTYSYSGDGEERLFRFWVNEDSEIQSNRFYYDILVGDNFFEHSELVTDGLCATQLVDLQIPQIYSSGYNVFCMYNTTTMYSHLIRFGNVVASTLPGEPIVYYGLLDTNYMLRVFVDEHFSTKFDYYLLSGEINNLGELVGYSSNNKVYTTPLVDVSTLNTMQYADYLELVVSPSCNNLTVTTQLLDNTILQQVLGQEILELSYSVTENRTTTTQLITVTTGSGVIDL